MAKALVVDDDDDIRTLVRMQFERKGWDVDEASDGEQALARNAQDYQVVLLDQKMPALTGDAAAVRFREEGYTGPIIFFSAYLTGELEAKLLEQVNMDLHIVAKTDFAKLVEVIDTLTNRQQTSI